MLSFCNLQAVDCFDADIRISWEQSERNKEYLWFFPKSYFFFLLICMRSNKFLYFFLTICTLFIALMWMHTFSNTTKRGKILHKENSVSSTRLGKMFWRQDSMIFFFYLSWHKLNSFDAEIFSSNVWNVQKNGSRHLEE